MIKEIGPVRSMMNLNGNILCAIDTETTGLDPDIHEIAEICILPLDSNIQPVKDILPFNLKLKPFKPHLAQTGAMTINKLNLEELCRTGFDQIRAIDLLEKWIEKLRVPVGKKISPLAHNWPFDMSFIIKWVGVDFFNMYFDHRYRDTLAAALYENDRAVFHANQCRYPLLRLSELARQTGVEFGRDAFRAHTALGDCVAVAELYRRMCIQGLWG